VLPHIPGIRPGGETPVEANESLLTLSFHVVHPVAQLGYAACAPCFEMITAVAPSRLDEKPWASGECHTVERSMQDEGTLSTSPPVEYGSILRSGLPVGVIPGEPKLDIISWWLAHNVHEIGCNIEICFVIVGPGQVAHLAIGIDVRHDPPLVSG
jgi:hypothetical protein